MDKQAIDLTEGKPLRQLLSFSLPLVAGILFQQFYSLVDTIMVGRLIGEDALAAVGTTYSLTFLTLGFVQGCCVGFGIPLAQSVGARDAGEYKRYFFNGVCLCAALSLGMTSLCMLLSGAMLRLMAVPEDIFPLALRYARVIFAGLPAAILYNYCAGVLRSSGDSRRPTVFLFASSFLNIALDYLLIALIPMGISGAALATVLSQLVSGLLNLFWILRRTDLLQNSRGFRRPSVPHLLRLCRLGLPMGMEYSISALGAFLMQRALNPLGTAAIAGQTAGERIRQMFTLPMEAVGMGMATYAGQNEGAGRYDRIRSGIRAGLAIQWSYCAAAWLVIFLGKAHFTAWVLGSAAGESAALSVQYLGVISCLFCLHGALMIQRNTLQGMGYSLYAVLSGVGELVGRAFGGWLAVNYLGFFGICIANPLAWGFALAYCSILVSHCLHRRMKATLRG